jgi:hypothetical protein
MQPWKATVGGKTVGIHKSIPPKHRSLDAEPHKCESDHHRKYSILGLAGHGDLGEGIRPQICRCEGVLAVE